MKKLFLLLSAVALCLCVASCSDDTEKNDVSKKNNEQKKENYEFTVDNYPKMGGSLANLPLGEAVTSTVLGIDREEASEMISFEGSTTDNYRQLVDGDFDIILAYEMSEEAKAYCEEKNVELEYDVIGVDALVFIAGKENSVEGISSEQIKEIYRGNITNWNQIGGDNEKIIPYQRNKDSGSQTLFDKLINLGDELMEAPADTKIDSMIGLLEAVADYESSKNALGYTVYYYLTNMEADFYEQSKLLCVDGVYPTKDSIASGEYPYTNEFYVVIKKSAPTDSPERILYNWIISEQGKKLVEQENYVVR